MNFRNIIENFQEFGVAFWAALGALFAKTVLKWLHWIGGKMGEGIINKLISFLNPRLEKIENDIHEIKNQRAFREVINEETLRLLEEINRKLNDTK